MRVHDALKAEGFPIPDNCREARVIVGVNQALMIQYDVFLDKDNIAKLGRALQRMGEKP
jgi:hypothetical protein